MIQRLLDVLRELARTTAAPDPHCAQALAGDLGDALYLVDSCQQERIGESARAALQALQEGLDGLAGAVAGRAEWEEVRNRAERALRLLQGRG